MKKERKSEPVDLSKRERVCHMIFCHQPGINPYILDEEIVFYCDECLIEQGTAWRGLAWPGKAGQGKAGQLIFMEE